MLPVKARLKKTNPEMHRTLLSGSIAKSCIRHIKEVIAYMLSFVAQRILILSDNWILAGTKSTNEDCR